jgi:hypothetical protein
VTFQLRSEQRRRQTLLDEYGKQLALHSERDRWQSAGRRCSTNTASSLRSIPSATAGSRR